MSALAKNSPDLSLALPMCKNSAIMAQRRQAASLFARTGLPGKRDEDWKYTDLSAMRRSMGEEWWVPVSRAPVDTAAVDAALIAGLDADRLVFVDGYFHADLSTAPHGVKVVSLAALIESDPDLAEKILALDEQAPLFNGLVAVNAALAGDGICICIPDGVCLDRPLYVVQLAGRPGAVHLRHAISIGHNAKAVVIEHFSGSTSEAGLTNTVTSVCLNEGARLTHYLLQMEGAGQFHIGRIEVKQAHNSSYESHAVAMGATLSRTDIHVDLCEEGAECALYGLYRTGGNQHTDFHTRVDHRRPDCSSREFYRGILDGGSRAVFNGKVVVHDGADGTDARQANHNLLLSETAEIDTKPELEIYADDVKCSHGATVGQLDDDAMFYLQSRGIGAAKARSMLTFAFADDVISRMGLQTVRTMLEEQMIGSMPEELRHHE